MGGEDDFIRGSQGEAEAPFPNDRGSVRRQRLRPFVLSIADTTAVLSLTTTVLSLMTEILSGVTQMLFSDRGCVTCDYFRLQVT
jgi:hypothetical protein